MQQRGPKSESLDLSVAGMLKAPVSELLSWKVAPTLWRGRAGSLTSKESAAL